MIYLILLSIFLSTAAQILVKFGAKGVRLDFSSWSHFVTTITGIIKNFPVMSGLILYGISFLAWVKVLSQVELSYAYPMVSISYVIIILFSYLFFKENITPARIIGVLLIIIGVIFVAKS